MTSTTAARRAHPQSAGAGLLGTTAHPVNEIIPGNAVRPEDFHGDVQINGIGQNSQGLFSKLGKSCPAQHVNYILPSRLHRACPTLLRNLTVSLAAASRHTAADVRAFPSAW